MAGRGGPCVSGGVERAAPGGAGAVPGYHARGDVTRRLFPLRSRVETFELTWNKFTIHSGWIGRACWTLHMHADACSLSFLPSFPCHLPDPQRGSVGHVACLGWCSECPIYVCMRTLSASRAPAPERILR